MEDNKKEKDEKEETRSEVMSKRMEAHHKLQKLKGDSPWTLTQQLMQEVIAGYTVIDPNNIPKTPKLVEDLKNEIISRYEHDQETKELLLTSIPSDLANVRKWFKQEGWETAVWSKIRMEGLFTSSKRAEVIESLRQRAINKSDIAAKIWLTLSGDYQEKETVNDKSVDLYREINKILHSKKDT